MVSDQTEIKRSMTSAATWPDSGPTLVSPPTPTKFPTMYFHHSYQLQNPGADASISSGLGPYSAVTSAHSSAQSGRAKNAHMAKTAMGTNTMPKKKKARKAGQQLGHLKCDERTLEAALESGAGRILILSSTNSKSVCLQSRRLGRISSIISPCFVCVFVRCRSDLSASAVLYAHHGGSGEEGVKHVLSRTVLRPAAASASSRIPDLSLEGARYTAASSFTILSICDIANGFKF